MGYSNQALGHSTSSLADIAGGGGMNQYDIIEMMLEDYCNELPQPEFEDWHWVQQAAVCIHDKLFEPLLTPGWIKDEYGITDHGFSAKFAHCFGQTPEQYILNHRIEAGKQLLQNEVLSDVRISEIALSLGFHSLPSFDAAFKKRTGCTPGRYRRNQKAVDGAGNI